MQSFYTILIIAYLLGLGFITIGKIRLKKLDKEFSKSNCDISEMERKKRLPYVIYIIIGCSIPVIASIFLLLDMFNII